MATIVSGEQKTTAVGLLGPLMFTGSLAANTPTDLVVPGSNTYRALIPMLTSGNILAVSAYRMGSTTTGAINLQVGILPAAGALTDPLQAASGAQLTLSATGGAYVSLFSSPAAFQSGDSLGITISTPTAGTALLTAHIMVGA